MSNKIGFTTTVPVEIILAAGYTPVDLNNVLVSSGEARQLVARAEAQGYPATICAWIRGLYSVALEMRDELWGVIGVTQGDCSNTHALMETLEHKGVRVLPFAFPYDRDRALIEIEMHRLADKIGTDWQAVLDQWERLKPVRRKLRELDNLSWQQLTISSGESHLWLVSSSDFNGDPERFDRELQEFLDATKQRTSPKSAISLGYVGVPPIITDLFDVIEQLGGRVAFHEVARQFSMPFDTDDIVEQYLRYTYPYSIFARIADIKAEIKRRSMKGIIHYTQAFCFRQIEDMILRDELDIPILTIQGDAPGPVDARTRVRLEAFMEMLRE